MRTIEEVAARIASIQESDMLGFATGVLVKYLPFDAAKPFLKPEAKAEDWITPLSRNRDSVLAEMRDYMPFAWDKAENHRGISASRSVDKMTEWLWMLGEDDLKAFAESSLNYSQYGAPILFRISEALGFPIPEGDGIRRMAKGLPCRDSCDEGCES